MKNGIRKNRYKDNLAGYLFILPNFLGVFIFILFPLLISLAMVFMDWDYLRGYAGIDWVGFDNFKSVMYNPSEGPINQFLRGLGLHNVPGWLASQHWALPAIIIMVAWTYTGYTMVLYMAGIQGIPKDLYEAAEVDGASRIRQFFSITIPRLKPTSFMIAITLIISTFQVFAAVSVMTKGGPLNSTMVLSYYIYIQAFQYYKVGYAATVSWALFLIILLITLVQWKGQKRWQDEF